MPEAGRRFRPTVTASLVALIACLILVMLGTWQLQRRAWKEALIDDRASRLVVPPMTLPGDLSDISNLAYYRVTLDGVFLHDKEVLLANRVHKKEVGRHILTPLQLDDGRIIMVDRGWVPMTLEQPAARAAGQIAGPVMLTGQLRSAGWQGYDFFRPVNEPAKGLYIWLDLPTIAQTGGLDRLVTTLYVVQDPIEIPGGYPLAPAASAVALELPNNHLQYAITWYALAGVLLVIYFLYHWRPTKQVSNR